MTQDQKSLQFLKFVYQNLGDDGLWRYPVPFGGLSVEQHYSNFEEITKPYNDLLSLTDSVKAADLNRLRDYIESKGLIKQEKEYPPFISYSVTSEGIRAIENAEKPNHESSQIFVAMWLHESLNDVYERGFKLAIIDAGYKPRRIDQELFIGQIPEEIIKQIQASAFVVADFSKGHDGARGSVYYEAGFAHGRDIPVIFTCRQEDIEDLHFDTSHYNHIVWKDAEDLRKQLAECILSHASNATDIDPKAQ